MNIAPGDIERLRVNERGSGASSPLYRAALAVCATIIFSTEPVLASLIALLSVALAAAGWLWRR